MYEVPPGAQTARLKSNAGFFICNQEGKRASISRGEDGYMVIPAGTRITVGASHYAQGYNVSYSCAPRVSFVPVPGASYYQDLEIEAERCTALVYREVDTNPVGLELVPTLARGAGC